LERSETIKKNMSEMRLTRGHPNNVVHYVV